MDATDIEVRGQCACLSQAVDQSGNMIAFHLSPTRNTAAAKRFPGKALDGLEPWELPHVINTDEAPACGGALAALKK